MDAVVFCGKEELELQEVPQPKIVEETDALVKVTATTICGSDMHIYHGGFPMTPGCILGHEGVGVVEEVGKGVRHFKKGQRVAISCVISCGSCFFCRLPLITHCERGGVFGMAGSGLGDFQGIQAQWVKVPFADTTLFPIPDELSDEDVLFVGDILATGYLAVLKSGLKPGETVAVFGSGPVGLCAQICAINLFGPKAVMAVDTLDYRLDFAEKLGSVPVNAREHPMEKIFELSGGRGVDVAIEAVGSPATLQGSLAAVRFGGRVSSVGVYERPVELPMPELSVKDITLTTAVCDPSHMQSLIDLLRVGKISTKALITHHMSLKDALKAYDLFDKKEDGVIKIVLKP